MRGILVVRALMSHAVDRTGQRILSDSQKKTSYIERFNSLRSVVWGFKVLIIIISRMSVDCASACWCANESV